jgi:hypothetical protein
MTMPSKDGGGPAIFRLDPEANEGAQVSRELRRLADANGGLLLPGKVAAAAADPGHPLHGYFEWDDQAAACQYRLTQAAQLIESCAAFARMPLGPTRRPRGKRKEK